MKKLLVALSLLLASVAHAQQLPPTVVYYPNASTRLKLIGKLVMTGAGVTCDTTTNAGFVTCTFSGGGASLGNYSFSSSTLSLPANAIFSGASSSTNTTGLAVTTNVTDGASSVGLAIDNTASLSSGKMLSLRSAGAEKWYFTDGIIQYNAGPTLQLKTNNGDGYYTSSGFAFLEVGGVVRSGQSSSAFYPYSDNNQTLGTSSGPNRWKGVFSYWHDTAKGAQLSVSTNTITPTSGLHHVNATGGVTISTIATTNVQGNAELWLIADGGTITISTGGNIAFATSIAQNSGRKFVYDGTSWYPEN